MSKPANRFGAFADPEEVAAQQKQQQAQEKTKAQKIEANKRVVVKKAPTKPVENEEEFQMTDSKRTQTATRGDRRGGRGGQRGDRQGGDRADRGDGERGGRGGRGERRGGRGGERGGRDGQRGGRGGRPRTAAVEGEGASTVERAERGGQRSRFQGKAREEGHPMDRQDGTGKAHRGDRKGGNQKGGWGGKKPTKDEITGEGEEEKKTAPEEEEKKEAPAKEEPVEVEEEEEEGFTLDDYFAQKQATSQGLLKEAAIGREHAKISERVQERGSAKAYVPTITTKVEAKDTYAVRKGDGAELLGFVTPGDDEEFGEARRGGRGGARGGRGGREPREPRQGGRGGRKNKLVVDDNDFPAL